MGTICAEHCVILNTLANVVLSSQTTGVTLNSNVLIYHTLLVHYSAWYCSCYSSTCVNKAASFVRNRAFSASDCASAMVARCPHLHKVSAVRRGAISSGMCIADHSCTASALQLGRSTRSSPSAPLTPPPSAGPGMRLLSPLLQLLAQPTQNGLRNFLL